MGTQMESVSRRVRTIYSVIASSNRLEILRILNTKGPLSYSELKTLAGFKSKKESGKFGLLTGFLNVRFKLGDYFDEKAK